LHTARFRSRLDPATSSAPLLCGMQLQLHPLCLCVCGACISPVQRNPTAPRPLVRTPVKRPREHWQKAALLGVCLNRSHTPLPLTVCTPRAPLLTSKAHQ